MVLFGQIVCFREKLLCSAKVVVNGQSGSIRAKMVVFGKKLLYTGERGCIRDKVVVFGQSGCVPEKVVIFGQKWLYSG